MGKTTKKEKPKPKGKSNSSRKIVKKSSRKRQDSSSSSSSSSSDTSTEESDYESSTSGTSSEESNPRRARVPTGHSRSNGARSGKAESPRENHASSRRAHKHAQSSTEAAHRSRDRVRRERKGKTEPKVTWVLGYPFRYLRDKDGDKVPIAPTHLALAKTVLENGSVWDHQKKERVPGNPPVRTAFLLTEAPWDQHLAAIVNLLRKFKSVPKGKPDFLSAAVKMCKRTELVFPPAGKEKRPGASNALSLADRLASLRIVLSEAFNLNATASGEDAIVVDILANVIHDKGLVPSTDVGYTPPEIPLALLPIMKKAKGPWSQALPPLPQPTAAGELLDTLAMEESAATKVVDITGSPTRVPPSEQLPQREKPKKKKRKKASVSNPADSSFPGSAVEPPESPPKRGKTSAPESVFPPTGKLPKELATQNLSVFPKGDSMFLVGLRTGNNVLLSRDDYILARDIDSIRRGYEDIIVTPSPSPAKAPPSSQPRHQRKSPSQLSLSFRKAARRIDQNEDMGRAEDDEDDDNSQGHDLSLEVHSHLKIAESDASPPDTARSFTQATGLWPDTCTPSKNLSEEKFRVRAAHLAL